MNKSGLIDSLHKEAGISKAKAEQVIDLFFNSISDALARGDRAEKRGFCSIFSERLQRLCWEEPKDRRAGSDIGQKASFFQVWKRIERTCRLLKIPRDYKQ